MNKDIVIVILNGCGGYVIKLRFKRGDPNFEAVKKALEPLGFTFRRPEGR